MELTQKQEKEMNKHLGLGRHTKQEADILKEDTNKIVKTADKKSNVKVKKMSEYFDFVRKYQSSHSGMSLKDAVKKASGEYNKKKGTAGAVNISKVKKGKSDTQDFSTKKGDKLKTGPRKGQKAFAKSKDLTNQKTPVSKSDY